MEVGGQCHTPAALPLGKRPSTPAVLINSVYVISWDGKTTLLFKNGVSLHTYHQKPNSIIKVKFKT
jgi:hypothetical protein